MARIKKKIDNPKSCRRIHYKVRNISNFAGWWLRFLLMVLWCVFVGFLRDRLAFICGPPITTIEEVAAARFIPPAQVFRPNVLLFFEALAAAGGSFALAQGLNNSRASRDRMERIVHTSTTIAGLILKGAKPGIMRREHLQLHVFNCLAFLAVYPVCVLHKVRGNTHDPCVITRCNQAAKRLQQLRPLEDESGTESVTDTSTVTIQEGTKNEMEHFFEILSLELEWEFHTSFSRSKLPSMAPQRTMYNLRNHLDDLADFSEFDPLRTPIIRENVDALAMSGRECSVHAYRDNINPLAFLWTIDIAARVLCASLPLQTCTTLAWSMISRVAFEIVGISVIAATALTILNETWRLWDPFAKAFNMYAWTLGLAREIDAMLNDVYDSDRDRDKGPPLRKHGYNATWEIPTYNPPTPTADKELPRVVDELHEIAHQLASLTCCHEGMRPPGSQGDNVCEGLPLRSRAENKSMG